MTVPSQSLSRVERKLQRTRLQIIRAAAELVIEEDYERATIVRIAERADVAVRTVTKRFPSKEDIFFEGMDDAVQRAEHHLDAGQGDALERLSAAFSEAAEHAARNPDDPEVRRLRSRAIAKDPELRGLMHQHFSRGHAAIARAVAADTGQPAESVGPQMIAAAAVTMAAGIERLAAEGSDDKIASRELGWQVLRGALDVLIAATSP